MRLSFSSGPHLPTLLTECRQMTIVNNCSIQERIESSRILGCYSVSEMISVDVPQPLLDDHRGSRLFPDYKAVEQEYYRRTGIFSIMRVVEIRKEPAEITPSTPQGASAETPGRSCEPVGVPLPPAVLQRLGDLGRDRSVFGLGLYPERRGSIA